VESDRSSLIQSMGCALLALLVAAPSIADGSDYDCDLHLATLSIGGPLAFGGDREDKVMQFTVRLERAIINHLSVYGYAMHMDNDSTLRAYMYDREMYGFGLVLYY